MEFSINYIEDLFILFKIKNSILGTNIKGNENNRFGCRRLHQKEALFQTSLSQGIINLTALARIIQGGYTAQSLFAREVKTGAIVMALKRLAVDMEFRDTHRFVKILKNIDKLLSYALN